MSRVRGWVYVLTNKSMLGLVKVGFSTKDPALRAKELSGTGNPHSHDLAYDLLAHDPFDIEQRTHTRLGQYQEGKEWFRCTIEVAIAAIRLEADQDKILETIRVASNQALKDAEELLRQAETQAQELRANQIRTTNLQQFCKLLEMSYMARKEIVTLLLKGWKNGDKITFSSGKLTCIWEKQAFALSASMSDKLQLVLTGHEEQWTQAVANIQNESLVPCMNYSCLALHEAGSQDKLVSCGSCGFEFLLPSYTNGCTPDFWWGSIRSGSVVFLPKFLTTNPSFFETPKMFRY